MMESRKAKSSKSQKDSQCKVITNWQHTQEVSPAFKRLMMLLLQERNGNGEQRRREDNRPDNQMR